MRVLFFAGTAIRFDCDNEGELAAIDFRACQVLVDPALLKDGSLRLIS
jgi:hypothetical protein